MLQPAARSAPESKRAMQTITQVSTLKASNQPSVLYVAAHGRQLMVNVQSQRCGRMSSSVVPACDGNPCRS